MLKTIILYTMLLAIPVLFSCNKDNNDDNTTTLSKQEILVKKTWWVDETSQKIGGTLKRYIRSSGLNTSGLNMAALRITFNDNGTGTYVDPNGMSNTLTWSFTSADKHNMTLNIQGTGVNDWSMVEILQEGYLYATTVLPNGDLVAARWAYVP